MIFSIVIHKDAESDYGVTVPDLPGCFSAGETLDETLAMAKEAIELHIEGLIAEGQPVPSPTTLEKHKSNRDFAGGTWALVSIDDSKLRTNAKRLSITVPERVLDAMDQHAAKIGETRSGLIVRAVVDFMGRTLAELPPAKLGRPTKRQAPAEVTRMRSARNAVIDARPRQVVGKSKPAK